MLPNSILPDEELTDLCINHWKVLQKKQGFRFSIDAVLLVHFIQPKAGQQLLDMGTGSGVIPLLIAARHQQVTIDGIEIQPAIAEMAQRSVLYNGQQERITIRQQDLTQLPKDYARKYDWVVSNPPFFPIGSGKFSPNSQMAMARHEVGCTLDDVVKSASYCVNDRGHFAMIHRAERLPEILSTCQKLQPGALSTAYGTTHCSTASQFVAAGMHLSGTQSFNRTAAVNRLSPKSHLYRRNIGLLQK